MKLWTIRSPREVSILQANGVLITNKKYIESDFIFAYDWMVEKLDLVDDKPSHCSYPIWAWKCFDKSRFCRPDLRLRWGTKAKEELYLIELDIPDNKILLSEYHLWHNVLDKNYLAKNENDELLFESFLNKNNLESKLSPLVKDKVFKSWEYIFNWSKLDKNWHGNSVGDSIQAVFWELKIEWVTKITFFKSK